MSMLWCGGRQANALETANAVSADPAADALFPETCVFDRRTDAIFRFNALTEEPTLTVDLDMLSNTGDFEGSFPPAGWDVATTGTAAVTQEADPAHVHFGDFSALLSAGDGAAALSYDVTVKSGSVVWVEAWMQADATSTVNAAIRNQQTGNYWTGSAWTSTPSTWATRAPAATTYARSKTSIPVEDYTDTQGAVTTLRLQFSNSTAASEGWVDGVSICPAVNFISFHGHNIDLRSAPVVSWTFNDPPAPTPVTVGTMTPAQPSFYSLLSDQFDANPAVGIARFWEFEFSDTNSEDSGPIYISELVMGYAKTFRSTALPHSPSYSDQQVRVPRRFGAPMPFGMGKNELRDIPITVLAESVNDRNEFFDEWRCALGGFPVVVVPHTANGHTDVVFGILSETLPHEWPTTTYAKITTSIAEMQLPLIIG